MGAAEIRQSQPKDIFGAVLPVHFAKLFLLDFLFPNFQMKKTIEIISAALFLMFGFMEVAHAYLDPVSVTFILQGIAGAVAAVLAGVRSVRTRVVSFFKGLFGMKDGDR